ncbi:MAG: MBL fold metallo-hydrolase [Pseudomonadota bacterium]|nr:MBL fold metallo-hydrolase [Pseudomonadota bacterium]
MNLLEHQLDYPFGDRLPQVTERIEVAPGIFWLRMPLPFALDHINLWLLRDEIDGRSGWTLVDCGIASDPVREAWERLFVDGLDGLPLLRLLCTHSHPDHIGMADSLHRRFDAPLWISQGEYMSARVFTTMTPEMDSESQIVHYRRHGVVEKEQLDALRARGRTYFRSLVPSVPPWFHRISGGETVAIGSRTFRLVPGNGHSPEHIALYTEDGGQPILISGDMVLPRISTNVSVFEIEPEANPLEWYLRSLRNYDDCATDTLVLPSHGRPFTKLHVRLGQQHAHHAERLEVTRKASAEAAISACELLPALFGRRFNTHELTFALGEALAHLHALWYRGELRREIDAQGVIRFGAC